MNFELMKNSDVPSSLSPMLQIEFVDMEKLGAWWRGPLPGIHWRLYSLNKAGASLFPEKLPPVEMKPGIVYLLPSYRKIKSQCEGSPEQLFVHFTLNGCFAAPEIEVVEIAQDSAMTEIDGALRHALREQKQPLNIHFLATSLVSLAMSRVPTGTLCVGDSDMRIILACRDLNDNPAHPWSNEEIAAKYGLACDSFIRLFRQSMGVTPYRYLQTLRYAMAARLLESTPLSLKEICVQIGINDCFHFSREFKRYHERSPSVFRKLRCATKFDNSQR